MAASGLRKSWPRNSTTKCGSSRAGSTSRRPSARSCRQAPSPPAAWPRSSIAFGPAGAGGRPRNRRHHPGDPRRGVRPEDLYAVEYSRDFVRASARATIPASTSSKATPSISTRRSATGGTRLRQRRFRRSAAQFPGRSAVAYLDDLLDRIPHGRPIVQLTYGPKSPVPPGLGDYTVEHFDFVIRNIPPTQLWIYRRAARN